jgi:hypothetical protein
MLAGYSRQEPVRVRQIFAGVRYHLRRRAAAVCGVAIGLRPPVPGSHGKARRGQDRRHRASGRDLPEKYQPEPALPRWRLPRNATISCGCSTRAWGRMFCPKCGVQVRRDSVDEAAARLLALPEGSRWHALFPCGEHATTEALRDHLFELRKKGFNRLLQDGRLFEFFHPGIAAGYRLLEAPVRAGGPHRDGPGLRQRRPHLARIACGI